MPAKPAERYRTDVVVALEEPTEDTRNLEAPDPAALVAHILERAIAEAETLAGDQTAPDVASGDAQRADLELRLALAAWDTRDTGGRDEALRRIELAAHHPLAARLRLALGLAAGTPDALAAAQSAIDSARTVGAQQLPTLALEVADAWLWRHAQPAFAATIADRALSLDALAPPLRAHAQQLAIVGHSAGGSWDRVIAIRRAELAPDATLAQIAACAALVLDRANDAAGALAMCAAVLARVGESRDRDALGSLRLLDVAISAACRLGDARRRELLDRRATLLARIPGATIDTLATRHAVAAEHARLGEHALAAARYAELARDPAHDLAGAGARIALLAAAHAAAAAHASDLALAAHRELSASDCLEVVGSHAWRAVELAAARDELTPDRAAALADAVGGRFASAWLDVVELAAPTATTIARFEQRGGVAVRWAAAVAERLGLPDRAIALWQRATAESPIGGERDHLARLLRVDDPAATEVARDDRREQLSAIYAALAAAEVDPRASSALLTARGIVDLARGDAVEAEESLIRAAQLAPKDPMARIALAAVYRAGKRYDHLAAALAELAPLLSSPDARAAVAREHAELLDEHLGDPAGARASLDRVLADRPDDDEAMTALARLCERGGDHARAGELRKRAAQVAPPERAGERWLELARAAETRGDRDLAATGFARAAEYPAQRAAAIDGQIRTLRAGSQLDRALALATDELAAATVAHHAARKIELAVQRAELLAALAKPASALASAYFEILAADPQHATALANVVAPARETARWAELARAYRAAPPTTANLEILGEALGQLGDWAGLADVRRRQLDITGEPSERARLADRLAHLYEHELDNVSAALHALATAHAAEPTPARAGELVRLLRLGERWPELAQALELELAAVDVAAAPARAIELLLELGELRAGPLARPSDAIAAYEAVLAHEPAHARALAALEQLYLQHGRDRELAHLLARRADAEVDSIARGALFARVAALRANRDDIDGALAAYAAAFAADPTSRDVFTAMERVCYKAEHWAAAMQLYDTAIQHVERGKSRAYRLGDLYARRANVQLSFLGQVDAGIESLQKVVELDSNPAAAAQQLDELCTKRDDFTPLLAAWERRAEVQPDPQRRRDALHAAAEVARVKMSAPDVAMRIQRTLLALDPADASAAAALEEYFANRGEHTGLIDVLKAQLSGARTKEASIEIHGKIARSSEEGARDVRTATEHYLKMLELQPENRDALDALARIYESTEQWTEFLDVTRRLIKVTSDRTTKALLYFRCGSVMEAKFNREQEAIRYYDAAIKTSSACLPAVHGLRDLYRRREEWPSVIETLELEAKLWLDDKERAGVFAQIGKIYEEQLGDTERATNYYESALTVDAECVPASQALFEQLYHRGEWTAAQPLAAMLAQKATRDGDPSSRSEFFRKRGIVARKVADPKSAADSLVYALEIRPLNMAALDDLGELAHESPDAWDFDTTYRELDKVYRKRDDAAPLLARVHVARAALAERDGNLDGATALYNDALALAPADFKVVSAIADFHTDMRQWAAALAAIDRFVAETNAPRADRLAALMRAAEIHADGEMDPLRAIGVLTDVIRFEPEHQNAHYQIAQQQFLRGKYADARIAIDRVIELATAPGQPLSAEALARYYYYKGRILDAAGEQRGAASQYRRASEYDPGYPPPALVLARRAADAGDQRQAETILIDAAHAAMAHAGPRGAVPLQRGLARILLASGDRAAAIDAYRGILNVEPDSASDRVALAEIYAVDEPVRAIAELRKVVDRDIHHAPAYRLLASYYHSTGDRERAYRVLTALDLLGFAEPVDRSTMQRMRTMRLAEPPRGVVNASARAELLVNAAAHEPLAEIFTALAAEITGQVAPPSLGESPQPARDTGDPRLAAIAQEVATLFEIDAEVFVATKVPGLATVTAYPRRMIVVDRTLLTESDAALRFLFGMAYEAIRGGYAVLLQLGARQRRDLVQLLRNLLTPEGERAGAAAEMAARVRESTAELLERHAGQRDFDAGAWIDGMHGCAKRAGLLACDDFPAAIWMVARLAGEQLETHDAAVALGSVLGGADLVRFYLSDAYQRLRDQLADDT